MKAGLVKIVKGPRKPIEKYIARFRIARTNV